MGLLALLEQGDLADALVPPCRVIAALRTCRRMRKILLPLISEAGERPRHLTAVLQARYELRQRDLVNLDLLRWRCPMDLRIRRFIQLEPLAFAVQCAARADPAWAGPSTIRAVQCHIGVGGAHLIAETLLPHARSLAALLLKGNDILDAGLEFLTDAWIKLEGPLQLHTLSLGANGITKHGVGSLSRLFSIESMTRLRTLDLSDNQLHNLPPSAFETGFENLSNLETLDLHASSINGHFSATPLLAHLPNLRHLNLNYCSILETGAKRLSGVLPALTSLARLEMNANGLKGHKGTLALLQSLQLSTSLQELSMNRMDLDGKNVTKVLRALSHITSLRSLGLAHTTSAHAAPAATTSSSAGARTPWHALSALVLACPLLQRIDLQGNVLGEGWAALKADMVRDRDRPLDIISD
eukprot:Tamp_14802.p1 GENE.Tamp_14802~~Tamp_14802.p1  ORF type:complete len:413 (-),score=49.93 Tamp_14802:13-1251(-)